MSVPSVPNAGQAAALRRLLDAAGARQATSGRRLQARVDTTVRAQAEARARLINETMSRLSVSLRFVLDERSGTLSILVIDGSGRVVRQVPPEYFMRATDDIRAGGAHGLLLDEGA